MTKTQSYQDRAKSAMGEGGPQSERIQRVFKEHQERLLAISKENLAIAQKSFDYKQKLIDKVQALAQAENLSLEKRKQAQELLNKLKEKELELAKTITEETEAQQKMAGGEGGGPPGAQPPTAGGGGLGAAVFKGAIKTFLARELASIVQGAGNLVASTVFEGAQNKAREQGRLSLGVASMSGADAILSGRGAEAAFFQKERIQALRNALDAQGALTTRGLTGMAGSAIGYAGMGAGIGGGIGAMFGGVGAVPGAAIGAAAGGIYGGVKDLFSGQTGAAIKGMITPGDTGKEAVERYRAEQLVENYQANFEAEKNKNYRRTKAFDFIESNRDRFIQAQQTMGLTDQGLFDMLGDTSRGNFTIDEMLGAAGGIAGAGGSTAQMRNAGQAVQLNREYGLQNAAQLTGLLSRNIGGGKGVSDEVTKKLLSDAFSVGLDSSNFSRETEKFVSMSAKFIAESGAATEEAQKAVAAEMTKFITGTSMAQIDAGAGAREHLESKLGAGGSEYQKSLQFSAMGRGKLSGLGADQRISLMNMTPDQIKAGGIEIEGMASQLGMSVEDFQKEALKAKQYAINPFSGMDKRMERVRSLSKELGVDIGDRDLSQKIANEQDPERKKKLQELLIEQSKLTSEQTAYDSSMAGKTAQEKEAYLKGTTLFGEKADTGVGIASTQKKTAFMEGREADAQAQKAQLENANRYIGEYAQSAKGIANTSKELLTALDELTDAIKNKSKNIEDVAQNVVREADKQFKGSAKSSNVNVRPSR